MAPPSLCSHNLWHLVYILPDSRVALVVTAGVLIRYRLGRYELRTAIDGVAGRTCEPGGFYSGAAMTCGVVIQGDVVLLGINSSAACNLLDNVVRINGSLTIGSSPDLTDLACLHG